jgi:tRNA uridine 5-carboxymethylaminomethyl modification enzyme
MLRKKRATGNELERLKNKSVSLVLANQYLKDHSKPLLKNKMRGFSMLKRPDVSYETVCRLMKLKPVNSDIALQVSINAKYEGYIEKQEREIQILSELENLLVPDNFDYERVNGLHTEAREKLKRFRPANLASALSISGVTPADISVLRIYLHKIYG